MEMTDNSFFSQSRLTGTAFEHFFSFALENIRGKHFINDFVGSESIKDFFVQQIKTIRSRFFSYNDENDEIDENV